MSDSILDKVLHSREDQEKQDFQPVEVINNLVKELSDKEADVLRRRFGLNEHGKETLETIGVAYNVTRERIRQIENQSIQKMRASARYVEIMKPVEHLVTSLLQHHGGVLTAHMLNELLFGVEDTTPQVERSMTFIVRKLLVDKVDPLPKSSAFRAGWKLKLTPISVVEEAVAALVAVVQEVNEPMTFEQFVERFQQTEFFSANRDKMTDEVIESYLAISSVLAKNPYDEYGLAQWGAIQPRRMNDRVHMVLKKEGKPMHFEEIAERITEVFHKKAYPPTVHNELILNDEYVLVGRGIYALTEWGFTEGVVSSVIEHILEEAGKPLSRSAIVSKVLEQRIVKKNTIHLALTDKDRFTKTADGLYTLAPPVAASVTETPPHNA